jgi:2-polyprenyl-3-methyl-5-hydroxy-6-metoxy-1,4-benzoquinol methylase
MFAREVPEKLFLYNTAPRSANPLYFPYYSNILTSIRDKGYSTGMTLFEVGVGSCECLLAAREIGYDTFGIDVIERHVEDAKNKYGLDAETADFIEFDPYSSWDVIIMGDVLEHVSDPDAALAKAEFMLSPEGALWISTPNFDSAFATVAGHTDAMRRQLELLFTRVIIYTAREKRFNTGRLQDIRTLQRIHGSGCNKRKPGSLIST